MNIKCLIGKHKEDLITRIQGIPINNIKYVNGKPPPTKVCSRCGKVWNGSEWVKQKESPDQ